MSCKSKEAHSLPPDSSAYVEPTEALACVHAGVYMYVLAALLVIMKNWK